MLAFRKFWEVCWILAILIGIESCQDPDKNKEPVSKTDPENLVKTDGDKNEVKDEDKKEDENSTDILNSWSFVNPECHIANDEYGTFLLHINAYSIIREHTLYSDPYCQNITEKHTEEFGGQIKKQGNNKYLFDMVEQRNYITLYEEEHVTQLNEGDIQRFESYRFAGQKWEVGKPRYIFKDEDEMEDFKGLMVIENSKLCALSENDTLAECLYLLEE